MAKGFTPAQIRCPHCGKTHSSQGAIKKCAKFQRRKKDGMTSITSAELNEAGAFGEWPVDFGEVTLAAQSKYLDAAEARLFGAAR